MVNRVNENEYTHILTIEDPIEFVSQSNKYLINQCEVGPHTHSFSNVYSVNDLRLFIKLRSKEAKDCDLVASTSHLKDCMSSNTGSIYDFTVNQLNGTPESLATFRGKVLLIVNIASNCGFTPQYRGLEEIYQKYRDQGLEILGFPCNQFGAQEPRTADEISAFCENNYGVTFPLLEKIEVNGGHAAPLYQFLKNAAPGLLGSEGIKWNFTKFLVAKDGSVVGRFAPQTKPKSLAADIEKLLS